MEKLKTRYIILVSVLAVTAAVVSFLNYDIFYKADAAVETIKKIPLVIGKWRGSDVPLDSRVYDILETRAIINRSYVSNGKSVFLSLVYYPETKVDFHAPEACLSGRGVQVSKSPQSIVINYRGKKVKIGVNQLIRRDNNYDVLYFYFYKAGNFVGRDYLKLRMNLAWNKFFSRRRSGSLIRVSTTVRAGDFETASNTLTNFIQDLYPYLIRYL